MIKILVIEDDLTLRTEVSTILGFENYEVLEAENGLIGLKLAISVLPDLILCDIMMPEMDGIEVLEEIRSVSSTMLIPFIFITALAERNHLRQGMEKGADDYISKPFTRDELLNSIHRQLEKSSHIKENLDKEMNQLRETIISHIPHELNTPLHGILGFSHLIQEQAGKLETGEIQKMAEYITLSGNRLLKLVTRYNYFIGLLAGKNKRQDTSNAIAPPVLTITEILTSIAKDYKRSDDILFSTEEADVMIKETSKTEFETILNELIDNAFKFSAAGSKVIVKTNSNAAFYNINISDSGRGISSENLKKIGAFNQFDRDKYEQQGSGLGLIISRLLVELNGGKFKISSVLGDGTSITVSFPIL